ncbi:hypothetical protein HBO08_15530 [Pseudomonas rhodesiae]|uniref:hypothetical protein n=1 Tax=Pseudomonas rhodesiae TaxID=76760 RepID=UPI001475C8C4|nr:hypothetical protein [Pseudomonas rhodesiae]NMZ18443.1 hypothetical protein [Pseudomonas rhodesiae]
MDLNSIKIATRNNAQKIWLVRADGGHYFDHFRSGSLISIKHLDQFYNYEISGSEMPTGEMIEQLILRKENFRSVSKGDTTPRLNAKGRRAFNQILHFKDDIKKGDLIVSLNDYRLVVGICTSSEAFFSNDPISFMNDEGQSEDSSLPHTLRKKVKWGPVVKRSLAEGVMRAPLRCQQTISRLDDYWKELYSLIYPFYTDGEYFYFSNFLGTKTEVGGKIVGRLFSNLADVEQIFAELLSSKLTDADVNRIFEGDLDEDVLYSLTTKAFFRSPGGITSKLPIPGGISEELALKGMALLFMIFTGLITVDAAANELPHSDTNSVYNSSGMIEERTLNPTNTKNVDRMLGQLVNENSAQIKKIKKRQQSTKVKQKLKLSVPDFDTSVLEVEGAIEVTKVVGK